MAMGKVVNLTGEDVDRMLDNIDRIKDYAGRDGAEGVIDGIAWLRDETADDGAESKRRQRREKVRRLLGGTSPDAPSCPPDGIEWVNRTYLARGGNPLAENAPLDDWREAPDIERIAEALIAAYPKFRHLRERRIRYRWKREGGNVGGKDTLGKCVKVGVGHRAFDVEDDFLIWLAADHAYFHKLTLYQMVSLIGHELCHAAETEKKKPKIAPHDVTAFVWEIEEFGLWMRDLELFGRAVARATGQLTLWDDRDEEEEGEEDEREDEDDE
jgi:hypothetical protein